MRYYKVWLNGQGLQDLSDTITVTKITEKAQDLEIQKSPNAKYNGTHITGVFRRSKEINIGLWLKDRTIERRAALLDKIQEWANADGALTVNYRPHQRLQAICTAFPQLGGDWKWVEELEMTFTAYGVPFWQDESLTSVTIGSATTYRDLAIQPPGTASECFLRWDVANSGSGNLTALKLESLNNGDFITLNGLSIPSGGRVIADYDLNGYLSIKDQNGNTLLDKRNANSFDDIRLTQRKGNTIRITADSPVSGTISARGLYL